MNEFSAEESQAIYRALKYWVNKWDWECPTLFGLEKSQMQSLVEGWPKSLQKQPQLMAAASLSSFREILYGASSVPKSKIMEILGISYEQAGALCSVLRREIKNDL